MFWKMPALLWRPMRVLHDESVPGRLGLLLVGHAANTVQRKGWAGIKNGSLLALAAAEFDVLLTADKGIEYQQNIASLPLPCSSF